MFTSGKNGAVRTRITADSARIRDICHRYVDPDGLLSGKERGALGLVLVGGLGYVRASGVLGICPRDMAALLRAALLRMAASAAVEDGSQVSGLAHAGRGPA
jgi:hypothetical protein